MGLMKMPTYAGGGGCTLTHIADVANIRANPYTFSATGKYIVVTGFSTTNGTSPTLSNYSVNNCTIDTASSNIYATTSSGYTVSNAFIVVDVTSANATIQCDFSTNAQTTQVYKIE